MMSPMEIQRNVTFRIYSPFRGPSLITGRVGATKREGAGQIKFYPYKKVWGEGFSHVEEGHNKLSGNFNSGF